MNYATELVAMLADGLTEPGRRRVSLYLLGSVLSHKMEGPSKLFDLDSEEMKEITMTVVAQLAASGLTDSPEFGVLSYALITLEGLADYAPRKALQDLSTIRERLAARVAASYTKYGLLPEHVSLALRHDPFLRRLEDETR